ncbi:hypothetical protein SC1083_2003 [Aggregatibacter actinomycetemcomitans serotype e str. SC1083]|uniref:Uncharacterized protein n=1 Tax=Aggregatibacter actinomycetemcomitans serotype e str. SC1083 TaxID=907488 RepID=G4AAX3_AGGAC|nr:hypothetical protein SC1083_2003 [Aggregatibacter actinomycetemcomitans serotype e str. SC1083]
MVSVKEYFNASPRAFIDKSAVVFGYVFFDKVSRFGANPKPTVTVWMKENKKAAQVCSNLCLSFLSSALILV